jgi:hypothetical protein
VSSAGAIGKPSGNDSSSAASAQHMELYKLAVEMADRVSARRGTANAFFVTVNTALLGFMSTVKLDPSWPVAVGGFVLALTWAALIKSYRDLNSAKFDVILRMEDGLPVRVYGGEWKKLKEDPQTWRKRYAEFTTVEWIVPAVFAVLYVALFLYPPPS